MSPFRSKKQRDWMKINQPEMYARWKADSGTKIVPVKKKKKAKK